MTLDAVPGLYAICRLSPVAPVPAWAGRRGFSSITRTTTELSIVCASDEVPADVLAQRRYRALAVRGPLDFSMIAVIAPLAATLASASISIFVLSTYDTDYLFVRDGDLDRAVATLREAGHTVATGV